MMDLCYEHRGTDLDWQPLDPPGQAGAAPSGEEDSASAAAASATATADRVLMRATLPLAEIVTDFFDKLKSRSSGFASFE